MHGWQSNNVHGDAIDELYGDQEVGRPVPQSRVQLRLTPAATPLWGHLFGFSLIDGQSLTNCRVWKL
jgi:hypothetical protein